MFESKVYECQACGQFFFFKQDADDHTSKTGHASFKVTDWTSPAQPSPRINRGKAPI
ncbi:hypothetical protein [Candidatus Nitrososphaera gargensis]|nr:hypothetical protein [Candidatus Nitrososphaera gargensis]